MVGMAETAVEVAEEEPAIPQDWAELFDLEALKVQWEVFASKQMAEDRHALAATLKSGKLSLEGTVVWFEAINTVQVEQLSEVRLEITEFLRRGLVNAQVEVQIKSR